MMGQNNDHPSIATFKVHCVLHLYSDPGAWKSSTQFSKRILPGILVVRVTGQQGSGMLRSMSAVNYFVTLTPHNLTVEPGTLVNVQPVNRVF